MIEITFGIRMSMSNDEEVPWSDNNNEVPWANPTKNAVSSVQVQGNSIVGQYTETNAVLAMILAAVSYFMCGICSAIPAVIMANGALQITSSQPGHPDQGLAKAAQIMGWVMIILTVLGILIWGILIFVVGGVGLLAGS
jgi:predicted membrane-bound mannosyltransferase|tara:strand:+ start:748 stop:1164 length:417 start_codon:yes stop_codon:yes gene_type:complete